MKNCLLTLCLFFLLSTFLSGQNQMVITGQILDQKTNKGIPYAHVGLPKAGLGTTSGKNGYFEFKVPSVYKDAVMSVSFMGYKTFRKNINKIEGPIKIYLEQAHLELTEVVVADEYAIENIIRKAVKNIPNNYPVVPTTVRGFYRESRTNSKLEYHYLAEGVLNIYKHSYIKKKEGMVSLVQGRRINLKNPLDTVIRGGLGSGHMAAHRFDFVQNREDFIDEKYFPVYKYWIESMTSYNGQLVYVIGFDKDPGKTISKKASGSRGSRILGLFGKKNKKIIKEGGRMKGRIYIEKNSYAFIKAEFEFLPEALNKTQNYPLYAGSWDANSYVVNYRQLGDTWYFSDATREGILSSGSHYSNEIKITKINSEKAKPLPYKERLHRGQNFTRMTGSYDPDFWKSYNTTPLNEELAESVRQLENAIKAREVFDTDYMLSLQQQRDSIYRAELEAKAEKEGESIDVVQNRWIKRRMQKKRDYKRVKFHVGLGTHLLDSKIDQLGIKVFTDEENPKKIVELTDDIPQRHFEITGYWDIDIFFKKNLFVRFGYGWDFYNSIYKERSLGLGTELNVSKQRPVYLKFIARYAHLRYARKLGKADNDFGKFKIRGRKFNAKSLNLYYGSRMHNIKLSAEFSIELNPARELYVRGTYHLPFAQRNDIWLKERKQLFKKKRALPIHNDYIEVTQNDLPFSEDLPANPTISIAVGILFK